MSGKKFSLGLSFFLMTAIAVEASASTWLENSRVQAVSGSFEQVLCPVSGDAVEVRSADLGQVLHSIAEPMRAQRVQSFGKDRQETSTGAYIRIKIPSMTEGPQEGWVKESELRLRSQCQSAQPEKSQNIAMDEDDMLMTALDGVTNWTFPTQNRPSASYKTGARKFKASRSGGARLHAAADLYRVVNEPAVAASSGTVIRAKYYFYEGTYALEVKHNDGKVVRYGEITGKSAPGTTKDSKLAMNQVIGYIGKVNSGCCTPMLHYEMYAGTMTGALTQSGNKFQRRGDLMDPTEMLTQTEKAKFGQSY